MITSEADFSCTEFCFGKQKTIGVRRSNAGRQELVLCLSSTRGNIWHLTPHTGSKLLSDNFFAPSFYPPRTKGAVSLLVPFGL